MATPQPRSSWFKNLLATVTAASGVGYVATSYTISRWLTRAAPDRPVPPVFTPEITCETLTCTTTDGLQLSGWALTPPQPRATVALFHGLRSNRARMLGRSAFLLEAGFRCVVFDHRAHGQSQGRRTSFGYHERHDVVAVLDLICERWPEQPRAALGMSMGAAALCFAVPQSRRFQAVVLESLYHDLTGAFYNRIGCGYPQWISRFVRGTIWVTERRLGMRIAQANPVDWIAQWTPTPVLIVTGTHDQFASARDAERLFAGCREPRELALIPEAGHTDVFETGGRHYRDLVLNFLNRRLSV